MISPHLQKTAAGKNALYETAQGVLLVLVLHVDDVCRTVQMPVVLVPAESGLSAVSGKRFENSTVQTASVPMKTEALIPAVSINLWDRWYGHPNGTIPPKIRDISDSGWKFSDLWMI